MLVYGSSDEEELLCVNLCSHSGQRADKIAIVLVHWHFRSRSLCCVILHKMTLFVAKLFRRLLRTRAPLTGSPQSADHPMVLSRRLLSTLTRLPQRAQS